MKSDPPETRPREGLGSRLRDEADGPSRRDQRKQRTRESLLEAALRLMQQGRSFTGLGLREITREAGVVPTSFYRHFRDMDELGLALVEDCAITLRRLLREARRIGPPGANMIRHSVEIYVRFVQQHPLELLFISGERNGGSPVIRQAIRQEIDYVTAEMAQDIRHLGLLLNLPMPMTTLVCGLIVSTMLNAATDVLDIKPTSAAADLQQELIDSYVRQLTIIFLGATHWRSKPPTKTEGPAGKKSEPSRS